MPKHHIEIEQQTWVALYICIYIGQTYTCKFNFYIIKYIKELVYLFIHWKISIGF